MMVIDIKQNVQETQAYTQENRSDSILKYFLKPQTFRDSMKNLKYKQKLKD